MPQPWELPITQEAVALRRVRQMSDAHCGPAVAEMLLSHINVNVGQSELSRAIGAEEFIHQRGTHIDELASAIERTAPDAQLWYKDHAGIEELESLVRDFHYPVGVEWQGLFYDSLEEEVADLTADADFGHYSVVRDVDVAEDSMAIVDPYREFSEKDRYFSLRWFETRWWDINEMSVNGYPRFVRDDHVMFVVTRKGTYFPKTFGMVPGYEFPRI